MRCRALAHRSRRAARFAVVFAALSLVTGAAGAGTGGGHSATFDRCHQLVNLVAVPLANVQTRDGRANDLVPEEYTVTTTGLEATLQIKPFSCEAVTVGGSLLAGPSSGAAVGVQIDPPDSEQPPEGVQRADFYLLFLVTDSESLARWLRAGTGLAATHVPGIVYSYVNPPVGAGLFDFRAPPPSPSAFEVHGAAGAQNTEALTFIVNWWQETKSPDGKRWTVKLAHPPHDNYAAPADVTISADPGSELARVMGSSTAKPFLSLSERIPEGFEEIKTVSRN